MAGTSPKKVTMSQIAEAAGVSIPTVSKVINKRTDVAPATRERIERLLMEHGYIPQRSLTIARREHGGFVNLIVHHLYSPYELEVIRGVQQALTEAGCALVLSTSSESREKQRTWSHTSEAIDGVILLLVDNTAAHLRDLQRRRVPFVVVDRMGELGPDIPSVGATNWAGERRATQYALSLGHRRVGIILGPSTYACTMDRFAGYRTALEEAGIVFDPALVREGPFETQTGYEQAQALLALPHSPTAICTCNDEQASGVYQALHERHMLVPEDMSVIGFDDTFIASRLTPPLTTIRQPLFDMGRVATNMLLRLIAGERLDSTRVEIPTILVKRASCAPPHGS